MYIQWVGSATGLPQEGQSVEFVLDGRDIAMDGIYAERTFRSHWSDYPIESVRSWRPADFDSSGAESWGDTSPDEFDAAAHPMNRCRQT